MEGPIAFTDPHWVAIHLHRKETIFTARIRTSEGIITETVAEQITEEVPTARMHTLRLTKIATLRIMGLTGGAATHRRIKTETITTLTQATTTVSQQQA